MVVSYLSLGTGALAAAMTLQYLGVPVIHPPQPSAGIIEAGRRLFGKAACSVLAAAGGQVLLAREQGADVLLLPRDVCPCLPPQRLTALLRTVQLDGWDWHTVYHGIHGLAERRPLRVKITAWRLGRAVNRALGRLMFTALHYAPWEEQPGQIRRIVADSLNSLTTVRTLRQIGEIVRVGRGRIYACPQRSPVVRRRVGVWADRLVWSQPLLLLNMCTCLAEMGLEMVPLPKCATTSHLNRVIAISSCRDCVNRGTPRSSVPYINSMALVADNPQALGREIAACLRKA